MADEQEEREAESRHRHNMEQIRDLRGDSVYRLDQIVARYSNRDMDDLPEERNVRASIRADLIALQRRIDQTINSLQ